MQSKKDPEQPPPPKRITIDGAQKSRFDWVLGVNQLCLERVLGQYYLSVSQLNTNTPNAPVP